MARSNPQQRKLFADIWEHKGRSLVVIASITIGVFAIGVIATVFQLVLQETAQTFANAVPDNITLTMTDFDGTFAESVDGLAEISAVDARRLGTVKVLEANNSWTTLKYQAVDSIDGIALNIPEVLSGSREPGVNEILLVSDAMEALDAVIGDEIVIKLADDSQRTLTVVGEIADWTRKLDDIFFTKNIGFITMETLPYLQQPQDYNQLSAVINGDVEDMGTIDRIADQLSGKVEDAGGMVFNTDTKTQSDTPLDTILQALLMIMLFLGVLILALSVFLIANTMSALLAQQTRQIGVMKLVGAGRGQIVKMYIQLSLIYGFASLIVALPLGLLVGSVATDMIMGIINSKMTDVALVPFLPIVIIGQIVVAILIPLGAGLLPVLRGTKVSVQKALSGNLIDQEVDASWFDRWLESRQWAEGLVLVAIRNTFRKKMRLLTTVVALALGGSIFISVFNTQASLDDHLFRESKMIGSDLNLQFSQPYSIDRVSNALSAFPDITDVEAWGSAFGEISQGDSETMVRMIAVPQNSTMIDPFLHSGRWFTPEDQHAIIVNGNFFEDYPNLGVGGSVEIDIDGKTHQFLIVGETMKSSGGDLTAYLPFEDLMAITHQPDISASFRLSVDPPNDLKTQQKMARSVAAYLEEQGYRVADVASVVELAENTADTAAILIYVMLALAILTALVGSIGLTGTLGINILERTSEIGILRAIGSNNQSIIRMVLIEGLVTGGLSYLISLVLVVPVTLILKSLCMLSIFGTAGNFLLDWKGFVIWFGLILVFSVISSAVPAKNASRLTIREVLAYE